MIPMEKVQTSTDTRRILLTIIDAPFDGSDNVTLFADYTEFHSV